MNGIIVYGFLVQGSPYLNSSKEDMDCTHAVTGPYYFVNEEEKDKFVSNLTLAFSQLYNSVEITEVNKP